MLVLLILIIFIIGCKEQTTKEGKSVDEKGAVAEDVKEVIGPGGCKSGAECNSYCLNNPFECKAWCNLAENKDVCDKYAIKIDMPDGIPGAPCTKDEECLTNLCLNFKCEIPSPDNLAKKSNFKLPGNCNSMSECARYCAQPGNADTCKEFCRNFPSFCVNVDEIRASNAPEECKACTTCDAKGCISDCVYKCYAYMPFKLANIEELEKYFVFERKYQEPINGVWEPGPIYNRIGTIYFTKDYKDIGVNTYSIIPKYDHKDGRLVHNADYVITGEKDSDTETVANLIRAKKAGFQTVLIAHDLYDLFPDANQNKNEKINHEDYTDDIERTALQWAEVAEKYKSEYFVPINEFEYVLYENGYSAEQACQITNEMYRKIIPKVREIFKGKIYCRVGGMDAEFGCMDFSLCDIFGFTYGFSGTNYQSNFEKLFETGEKLSAKYGKPYIMAEAFAFNKNGIQACADLHKAGIQAYKNKGTKGIGYTFMGLIQRDPINKNDCTISEAKVVQDYTDFYKWLDSSKA